jgi:hypothetical protein
MSWLFITRRRHDREIASLTADRERIRGERNQFAKDRDAYKAAAETAARQFDTADRRLADATKQLAERRPAQPEADPVTASPQEIEAWEARVKAHLAWTPPTDREARPVDGASGRPTHPATDLRRALERCRALQALLDQRGKRVAS